MAQYPFKDLQHLRYRLVPEVKEAMYRVLSNQARKSGIKLKPKLRLVTNDQRLAYVSQVFL